VLGEGLLGHEDVTGVVLHQQDLDHVAHGSVSVGSASAVPAPVMPRPMIPRSAGASASTLSRPRGSVAGRVQRTVVPRLTSWCSTQIRPPWCSTIRLHIASPMPVPP